MTNIKVLLKEKVEKVGDIGEIVSVKAGYARNYLLPTGLALVPTVGEIKRIQKKKALLEKMYQDEKLKAEEVVKKLSEVREFVILAKAGEAGKLFGKITTKDIAEKINQDLGIEISRKQILLKRSIGELGEFDIKLKLHSEVSANIKVVIRKEE